MISDRAFDKNELLLFLSKMSNEFRTPLLEQARNVGMSLEEYAEKLARLGTIAYERNEGMLIGVVIGYTHDTPDEGSYITQVVVDPRFRGRGICSRLLAEYVRYCEVQGLSYVWLRTGIDNLPARHTYERAGFKLSRIEGRAARYHLMLD